MRKLIFVALLATGCSTEPVNKSYPTNQLYCPKDYIELCQGRNQNNMECQCVNRRVMERELRRQLDLLNG